MHQKLAPDPFLILLNNPKQPVHTRNSFKSHVLNEDYQKALEKLTLFFFRTQSLLMDKVCQKQKGSRSSDQKGKNYKNVNISRTRRAF